MGKPPIVTTDELASLARLDNWERIDVILGAVCDRDEFVKWATEGLSSGDKNERDLGASILEASNITPDEDTLEQLRKVMTEDTHPYAHFRAGFALFRHGDRSDEVVGVLHEALQDKEVAEIAQGYLDEMTDKENKETA